MSTAKRFESISAAAARLGVSRQWVQRLAAAGRIPGAQQIGVKAWAIPADFQYERRGPAGK